MSDEPDRHHRRSSRLKGYDYSQAGAYFVTIFTQNRACLFGQVVDGVMRLNPTGSAAKGCWLAIPDHFPFVALDAFVIMPNHVHGIIVIADDAEANVVGADVVGAKNFSPLRSRPQPFRCPTQTVGSIVRGFKIGVTRWFRTNTGVTAVWQRNYHDHIIRDDPSLDRIRDYIADNPARWAADPESPATPTGCRP